MSHLRVVGGCWVAGRRIFLMRPCGHHVAVAACGRRGHGQQIRQLLLLLELSSRFLDCCLWLPRRKQEGRCRQRRRFQKILGVHGSHTMGNNKMRLGLGRTPSSHGPGHCQSLSMSPTSRPYAKHAHGP